MLGLGVAAVSWLVGALVRLIAGRVGLVDIPNARSSHAAPVPRGGGAGIVIAVIAGVIAARLLELPLLPHSLPVLILGGGLIASVSFIDDRRLGGVPPLVRLGVHLTGAALTIALAGYFEALAIPPLGALPVGVAGLLITAVWITAMTNAYNFMDGIDGIAGAQAIAAAGAWAVAGWYLSRTDLMLAGILMASACAAFLLHNWHPAKLFMGDVGSAFLGFSLASLPVLARGERIETGTAALAGLLVLWPFGFDTMFTIVRRWRRGERLTQAHRSHLYQRLNGTGWGHQRVSLLYAGLAVIGAATAVGVLTSRAWAEPASLAYLVGLPLFVVALVTHEERARRV